MGIEIKSEGQCLYCQKMFTKAAISRHLNTHLEEMAAAHKSKKKAYHLCVEGVPYFFEYANEMFLNLLVDGNATLEYLDDFLREIWLECCGHMSTFRVKGKYYEDDWDDEDAEIGEKKSTKLEKVFKEDMLIEYEYDIGSTTPLMIKVVKELNLETIEPILLLSRNEPLAIMCDICHEKPAVEICSVHVGDEESFFCKTCRSKHAKKCPDFKDYASMPVVNSPRMGTCAYEGGMIDEARDGVFEG
jgi:hypothetical protein